jgi:hypothetical protein
MSAWTHLILGGIFAVLVALALAILVPGGEKGTMPQQAQIAPETPASVQ